MKKLGFLVVLVSVVMLVGCAGPYSPGWIVSDYQFPASSPDEASGLQMGSKAGTSQMVNYLGWVAIGDASIQAAAKSAGITKIKTVDVKYNSILGIINTTTTIITGE